MELRRRSACSNIFDTCLLFQVKTSEQGLDFADESADCVLALNPYGIRPNQLSAWRCLAKHGQLVLPAEEIGEPVFAPLVVCDPAEGNEPTSATPEHMIRIIRGAMQIELSGDTPADRIAAIVHALEAPTC